MAGKKHLYIFSCILILTIVLSGCGGQSGIGGPTMHTLVIDIIGNGSVTVDGQVIANGHGDSGEVKIEDGTMVVLEENPAPGWVFNDWVGDNGDEVANDNGEWKILMNGRKEITAVFVEEADLFVDQLFINPNPPNFNFIVNALQAANNGDVIEVAEGNYDENLIISGKSVTLRSTKPLDPAVQAATIIDGGGTAGVISFMDHSDSHLYGFTIQNGYHDTYSGGIYVHNSSPLIEYNDIKNNHGAFGGAVYNYSGSPIIRYNTIKYNEAIVNTDGGLGGGIYSYSGAPEIYDNDISDNEAGYRGGGIYIQVSDSAVIEENRIDHNMATYGGGIFIYSSSLTINNNMIDSNNANDDGGGIAVRSEGIEDYSEPQIYDNMITLNWAADNGGGIHIYNSGPEIYDNYIWTNEAYLHGGGIYVMQSSEPLVYGNDFQDNQADGNDSGSGLGGGIYIDSSSIVLDSTGDPWSTYNKPPIDEPNNTYDGNTHSSGDGADVYFED